MVDATLAVTRSWIADGSVWLQRVESGAGSRDRAGHTGQVDSMCAPLRTDGHYSCGQGGTMVINLDRWNTGIDVWPGPLETCRHYVVNHEYGHLLGHDYCPSAGQLDPVMAQQTKGLDGCRPTAGRSCDPSSAAAGVHLKPRWHPDLRRNAQCRGASRR